MPALKTSHVLPGAIGVLVAFLVPVFIDVSLAAALAYLVWTLAWWLLGTALVRQGHRRDAFTTLTYGGVVGLMLQLANWAVWQAVQLPKGTLVGGIVAAVVGAGLLVREARGEQSGQPERSVADGGSGATRVTEGATCPEARGVPLTSVWLWAALTGFMAVVFAGFSVRQTRPPGASTMYQDLYWHLGIAAELKRSVLPQVPQAQVGRLNYHWLSDAYMASGSLGSFTSTSDVALRLWFMPVVALTLALCLVVGRELSGRWVTGNVAMILTVAPASVAFLGWMGAGPANPFLWLSPSQIFGLVFTLWAVHLFMPVLRGHRPSLPEIGLLLLTVFVCAGAKSSILPVFCGGAALVFVFFVRRKAFRNGAFIVGLVCVAGIAMAMPLFAGGSAGSKLRLLSSIRRSAAYRHYTGMGIPLDHGPFVMPYLATGAVFAITAGLLLALVLMYAYTLTTVALGRTWRDDPLPLFLLGGFIASLAAYELIDHTGMSQAYFPLGALPLLALLSGWGTAVAWERAEPATRWTHLAVGVVVGGLVVFVSRRITGSHIPSKASLPSHVLVPAVVILVLVVLAAVLVRRLPVLGVALLLGMACAHPFWDTTRSAGGALHLPPVKAQKWTVQPAESAAAAWLRDHAGQEDLIATNVHCRGIASAKNCDRRGFWVSALTERRAFIESWGYTDEAQKAAGQHGLPATSQPFHDEKLYMLNENAFHAPSAQGIAELKKHGVRWMFGDTRASAVSPKLATYATLAHRDGPVSIYKLR